MPHIKRIESELSELQYEIRHHKLYSILKTPEDVKLFMEHHVYTAWDFMSLLKTLQLQFVTFKLPWVPNKYPEIFKFINEIVAAEESDVNELGQTKSHFEMYLDGMEQIGANTTLITTFTELIENNIAVSKAAHLVYIPSFIKDFIEFTFEIIETGKPHLMASVFIFGREDINSEKVLNVVSTIATEENPCNKLTFLLNRYLYLKQDNHRALSYKMLRELCGTDMVKWEEVLTVAKQALEHRIILWDNIYHIINTNKEELV
ncbi:heme oxygenase-like protein [Formosa agariphila KMM 3901]|uniref:Heme oxygenase-like protein n=1 Tax=Formosa agariphila (strain DSM 15362 / KCTC 12365 / LMG 23005 / KMM 3901 / M-2Alg 35-1) TaxID=1347342 RepID=T2KKZ3_FORAG|nr:DUF3050 domain-containing protein [Formosa agariphila]CDF79113.1 heme oxygenase-like protein [Formosa agariphila KMM 3901]